MQRRIYNEYHHFFILEKCLTEIQMLGIKVSKQISLFPSIKKISFHQKYEQSIDNFRKKLLIFILACPKQRRSKGTTKFAILGPLYKLSGVGFLNDASRGPYNCSGHRYDCTL